MAEQNGKWVTVNGAHVFIEKGQSAEEAISKLTDKKEKAVNDRRSQEEKDYANLSAREYGSKYATTDYKLDSSDRDIIDDAIYYANKNGKATYETVVDQINKDMSGFLGSNESKNKAIKDYIESKVGKTNSETIGNTASQVINLGKYTFNDSLIQKKMNDYGLKGFNKTITGEPDKIEQFVDYINKYHNAGASIPKSDNDDSISSVRAKQNTAATKTNPYTGDGARFNDIHSLFTKNAGEPAVNKELDKLGFNQNGIEAFHLLKGLNKEQSPKGYVEMLQRMFNKAQFRK